MTQDLQIESRVGTDGILAVRVALPASGANTDVIVTIRPKSAEDKRIAQSTWPPGYFEKTYGSLAADPLTIPKTPRLFRSPISDASPFDGAFANIGRLPF